MSYLCMVLGLSVFLLGVAMDWQEWKKTHCFVREVTKVRQLKVDDKGGIDWERFYTESSITKLEKKRD